MNKDCFITIPQLARILGISRIAVYKKVKSGQIPATRIGRTYVIADRTITAVLGKQVTDRGKQQIDTALQKTLREYGEVLKKLSKE